MGEAIKELRLPLKEQDCICSTAGLAAVCGIQSLFLFIPPAHYFTEHMTLKWQKKGLLLH